MPDTHLVMPCTLSAPYAELLEAETPQTMTASDAPPNGTAAAAAAFARLLASGDHAMQPDSYTLTGGPALPPQARDTAHHSPDLRATLLGSTTIPADDGHPDAEILDLGRRRAKLIQRINQSGRPGHEAVPLLIEWKEVDHLIMELEPKTAAGLAVQLSAIWSLSPEPDEENGPTADGPLERTWLWIAMKNAERIGSGAHLVHDRQDAALLSAWDDYRKAYSALFAAVGAGEESDLLARKLSACCSRVENIPAATMEGVLLKLRYLFAAIMESQDAIDAAVHGMPASDELLQEMSQDYRRQMLWSMIQPSLTATAANQAACAVAFTDLDAPIFAAYGRWSQLVRDCYAAKTDEDCERLSEQADEAAFNVMAHEPASREGLAAQVFVMLHLEHGGTTDDHLDIDFSALTGGDGPDSAAVQALVARVKQLGRRDGIHEPYAVAMEERIGTAASNDLRQAWKELRALDAAGDRSAAVDPDFEIYRQQREAITARILSAPIRTDADREILTRFALHSAVAHWGDEPTASTQGAEHIIALRRLLGAPAAANDQRQDADAFADTIAAFEAEAPATLALPQEPTGRMVDAGASAAGITPAQFQAAYAAAVEALKLERAA